MLSKGPSNLLRPLESIPASRDRVVPTEWKVRTVLGDSLSKARVVSIQAPQYRQCALIKNFLDLAKLSTREEATFATNWIKDLPEGLKLQNQVLSTITSTTELSQPKINCICSVTPLTNAKHWAQANNSSFPKIHQQLQKLPAYGSNSQEFPPQLYLSKESYFSLKSSDPFSVPVA